MGIRPVRAESALPPSEASPSSTQACGRPAPPGEGWPDSFARKRPPTGESALALVRRSVGGRLRANGDSAGSRGIRPPSVRSIAELHPGLWEAGSAGRRVARPVRAQAPSNRRISVGAGPKACWRLLAGEGWPDSFARKRPPTGDSGVVMNPGLWEAGCAGRRVGGAPAWRADAPHSRKIAAGRRSRPIAQRQVPLGPDSA